MMFKPTTPGDEGAEHVRSAACHLHVAFCAGRGSRGTRSRHTAGKHLHCGWHGLSHQDLLYGHDGCLQSNLGTAVRMSMPGPSLAQLPAGLEGQSVVTTTGYSIPQLLQSVGLEVHMLAQPCR